MHMQYTPQALSILVALTAAVCAAVAFSVWRRRPAPGATPLALFMLGVAVWSVGYAFEVSSADLSTIVFWDNVQYLGSAMLPAMWLVF